MLVGPCQLFRNHARGNHLGKANDIRVRVDDRRFMPVGDRKHTTRYLRKLDVVPTRQLDVVKMGVSAGHEVRHRDDPKDSITDSRTIELTIIFSVGMGARHVRLTGNDDDGSVVDGIDEIGVGHRHGIAPFS